MEYTRESEIAQDNDAQVQRLLTELEDIGIEKTKDTPNIILFDNPFVGDNFAKALVDADLLEAVITLPRDLFGSMYSLSGVVAVFQNRKTEGRKGSVIFIDAKDQCKKGSNNSIVTFREEDVDAIIDCYLDACNGEKAANGMTYREVTNAQVAETGYSLFDIDYED